MNCNDRQQAGQHWYRLKGSHHSRHHTTYIVLASYYAPFLTLHLDAVFLILSTLKTCPAMKHDERFSMSNEKQDNERVERRQGPADRRLAQDRRDSDRVVEDKNPRRQNPDRRKSP